MSDPLVVNIHRRQPYNVYIGRPSGSRPGPWGNPFVIGQDGNREQCIAKYRAWLPTQPQLMRELPKLRGKVLGCFCAPAPCHGDVLVEMANGKAEGNLSLFGGGKVMTNEEIQREQERIDGLEMGSERWTAQGLLDREKAATPDYHAPGQELSFAVWLEHLKEESRAMVPDWVEGVRASYYEGQPDAWLPSYADGDSPDDAIAHEMEAWED